MSSIPPKPFVPHVSEDDLGFTGSWRPMLSQELTDRGVKLQTISKATKDKNISGVIMPSFDWNISPQDPAFRMGVAPHMSKQPDPKKTVHFLPNPWAMAWKCYTFQGPANEHFISPSSREHMLDFNGDKDLLADAFNDIYLFIKRGKEFDLQAKDYYLKKPDITTDARVPLIERKYFANVLFRDKDTKEDTLVVECFTSAAYNYLIEQMRWATRYGQQPIDEDFPQYLIGDPTKPSGALVWHQEKMVVGGLKMESNVMCLTPGPEIMAPVPERRVISEKHLSERINLYDQASWNWPTYQEMADFALEHWTEVPRDLIAAACSHRANVGKRTPKATVSDGGGNPAGVGGAPVGGPPVGSVGGSTPESTSSVQFKDPTPPPTPAVTQAVEAAPKVETPAPVVTQGQACWVIGKATGGAVVKWTDADIRTFVATGAATDEQVRVGEEWKSFAAAGYVYVPPVVAQAPAGPEAPPPGPASAPPPPPPVLPVESNSNAALPESEMVAALGKFAPNYATLTEEVQGKVRTAVAAIVTHQKNQPNDPIPPEMSLALGQLLFS